MVNGHNGVSSQFQESEFTRELAAPSLPRTSSTAVACVARVSVVGFSVRRENFPFPGCMKVLSLYVSARNAKVFNDHGTV